jgi:hypothetical protein
MTGYPEHDCSTHEGTIRQASTTAAERGNVAAKSGLIIVIAVQTESLAVRISQASSGYTSPPGTAPPTTTPLVLRV